MPEYEIKIPVFDWDATVIHSVVHQEKGKLYRFNISIVNLASKVFPRDVVFRALKPESGIGLRSTLIWPTVSITKRLIPLFSTMQT